MDARRFDTFARGLANFGSRRMLFRSVAITAGGAIATGASVQAFDATGDAVGGSDGAAICPPSGRPVRRVTAVAPFPVFIVAGTCSDIDDSTSYNLIDAGAESPDSDPYGSSDAIPVSESMTTIRVRLDDLLAESHAVAVQAGSSNEALIACGEIGGAFQGDTLSIGLRERNGSGYAGIAKLTAEDSQTSVDVFVAQDLFELSTTWEGAIVVTTIDVNLRAEPSEEGGVIDVLAEGTELLVTGEPTGEWLPVLDEATGENGYVSSSYVEVQ